MSTMRVGDCTAHHGWVYHSAPAQKRGQRYYMRVLTLLCGAVLCGALILHLCRAAIAFSYVSSRSRALPDLAGNVTRNHRPFAREDELGYAAWLEDVERSGSIDGNKYLPVVYDEKISSNEAAAAKHYQLLEDYDL